MVALRARAGSIDPTGSDMTQVPFFKRYFLGGATNLRGWGRFEVAPLTEEGNPIGGNSFFNFSTELRVPIVGKLGGVALPRRRQRLDQPWDFNFNDLRYDTGPGLRYNTPIGPVRLDFGFQLKPIPGLLVNGEEQKRPVPASTSASARRSDAMALVRRCIHVLAWVGTLWSVLVVALALIVSQTPWFRDWLRRYDRARGEAVPERRADDRPARRQPVLRRARCRTSRSTCRASASSRSRGSRSTTASSTGVAAASCSTGSR